MPKKIAFLGPIGTYTDEASYLYAPSAERVPFASLGLVTSALEQGNVDEAVVPIENSLGGTVIEVVDFLIASEKSQIKGEFLLPIDHCLITRPGVKLSDIRVVVSKQEALTQCRQFLARELRFAEQVSATSTALAVVDLKEADDRTAAIGPRRAAELAGLPVLAHGIQDRKNNVTRFAVLASSSMPPSGSDKTTIAFDFDKPDAPGLVYGAMRPFAVSTLRRSNHARPARGWVITSSCSISKAISTSRTSSRQSPNYRDTRRRSKCSVPTRGLRGCR